MKTRPFIKHDVYSCNDDDIKKITEKYHEAGYGIWWCLVEKLTQSKEHRRTTEDLISDIKTDLRARNTVAIAGVIDLCLKRGLLKEENGYIYNERVIRQCEAIDEKSRKNAENVRIRWENARKLQPSYERNTNVSTTNNERNTDNIDNIDNIDNVIYSDNKLSSYITSAEPSSSLCADAIEEPTFDELPKIDGGTFKVSENQVKRWQEAFPAVDVKQQIKSAHSWLDCNPKNGKKDIKRFLNNWLSRCQEKAGAMSYATASRPLPKSSVATAGAFDGQKNANGGFDL